MQKILFLGGSLQQIPAITYAKKKGYYTILCDYLEDNPGRLLVDEFYCVSTTDKDAVLSVAINTGINAIVAYASDPAAPTAAYVGNKLKLPSNPYESVNILSRKDLFRKFLKENNFKSPKADSFTNLNEVNNVIKEFNYPLMIKPIDSSGSKGVSKISSKEEIPKAFEKAIMNSREKIVIIEEFIEMNHKYMVGGDGFVVDGNLVFTGFLNCLRNAKGNPYIPVGKSYPVQLSAEKIIDAQNEIQRLLNLLNIRMGALNIELMFDTKGDLYLIEVGPRNGGNMIPDLLKMVSNVDLVAATVEAALGNDIKNVGNSQLDVFYATYVLHSAKSGKFESIDFKSEIKNNIVNKVIYKAPGDPVEVFNGANNAIGIVFLRFSSLNELQNIMNDIENQIEIRVSL